MPLFREDHMKKTLIVSELRFKERCHCRETPMWIAGSEAGLHLNLTSAATNPLTTWGILVSSRRERH